MVRDFAVACRPQRPLMAALFRGAPVGLLGLPMTVKEQFNIASGLPNHLGQTLKFKDWRPTADVLGGDVPQGGGRLFSANQRSPEFVLIGVSRRRGLRHHQQSLGI